MFKTKFHTHPAITSTVKLLWFITILAIFSCNADMGSEKPIDDQSSKQTVYNPYPEDCPRKTNMTKLDVEENHICILRRRWFDELHNIGSGQNVNYARRSGTKLMHFKSTRPHSPDGTADCLHTVRKTVRFVPGNCYSKKFDYLPAATKEERIPFHNTWWNFAAEILGDLMYTFDFVLWGTTPVDETNQFWFLILYLKELATAYSNPSEIVSKASNEAYLEQLKEKLEDAKRNLKKRQEDHRILDYTLRQLKITMASYVQLMEDLRDKLSTVVLPEDESDQETKKQLQTANLAARELEASFRRANFRDLSIRLDKEIEKLHEQSDKEHNMGAVSDGEHSDVDKDNSTIFSD